MSSYRINDTTKWGMLTLALIFDGIQLFTPDIVDKLIIAIAFFTIGMILFEHGALTSSGSGALKIFRLVIPFAELFISALPAITLEVLILIQISRAADKTLPEIAHKLWGLKRMRGDGRYIRGDMKTIRHEAKQLRKYRKARSVRSKNRLRRSKEKKNLLLSKLNDTGRSYESKQRILSIAKDYSNKLKK